MLAPPIQYNKKMDFWCKDKIVNTRAYRSHLRLRRAAIIISLLEYGSFVLLFVAAVSLDILRSRKFLIGAAFGLIFATVGLIGALQVRSIYLLIHGVVLSTLFVA